MKKEDKDKRSTKFWQVAGVIVGIISIGFNVYQFSVKQADETIKSQLAGQLIQATAKLIGAEAKIALHEEREAMWLLEADSLIQSGREQGKLSSKYYNESLKYKALADELQKKLDSVPILDLTIDEHVRFFLKWTAE